MSRRPARTWTVLVTLAVLAGLLAPAAASAPRPPRRITAQPATLSFFGLNGYFTGYERTRAEVDTLLPMGPAIGMHWTREEIVWANIEPYPDTWHYDFPDDRIWRIANAGYGIIGMLLTTPDWARKSVCADNYWCPPANVWDYYDFVYQTVERYDGDAIADAPGSPRVAYWEIWNEPNYPQTWWPYGYSSEAERQAAYGDLLYVGYQAVKAADPTAQVLVGSVYVFDGADYQPGVYDGLAWLGQVMLYHPNMCNYFDIMAIHPHMPNAAPDKPGLGHKITIMGRLENALVWDSEHGCAEKAVFVTEVAWSTCTAGQGDCVGDPPVAMTEDQQANYLVRTYALAAARGIAHVNVFQLEDKFDGGQSVMWGECAIVRTAAQSYAPKKAYHALGVLTDQLEGFTNVTAGAWNSEPARFDYRFTLADGTLVDILWRADEASEVIDFAVEPGLSISWITRDGIATPLTPVGGYVTLTIGGTPGYLRQEAIPILVLSNYQLRYVTLPGETQPPRVVDITNQGAGTLNWTATVLSGSACFTVEPPSGTAPSTLTIYATAPFSYGYVLGQVYVDGGTGGAASLWLGLATVPTLWKIYLPLAAANR